MSIWQDCEDSVNLSSTHHLQVVLAISWSQTLYLMCSGSRAGFQGRLMCPWAVLTTKGRLCLRHVCYLCIWIATTTHPTLIIDDTIMHTALLWPQYFDTATLEAGCNNGSSCLVKAPEYRFTHMQQSTKKNIIWQPQPLERSVEWYTQQRMKRIRIIFDGMYLHT